MGRSWHSFHTTVGQVVRRTPTPCGSHVLCIAAGNAGNATATAGASASSAAATAAAATAAASTNNTLQFWERRRGQRRRQCRCSSSHAAHGPPSGYGDGIHCFFHRRACNACSSACNPILHGLGVAGSGGTVLGGFFHPRGVHCGAVGANDTCRCQNSQGAERVQGGTAGDNDTIIKIKKAMNAMSRTTTACTLRAPS